MKKKKKYIIRFIESKSKNAYIKSVYFNTSASYHYYNFPVLTPKSYLITSDMIFDTPESAKKMVDEIIDHCHKRLLKDTRSLKKQKQSGGCSSWGYKSYRRDCNRGKKFINKNNYEIKEIIPDFHCNKNRKTIKDVWKKDGCSKTFCVCCGNNIYYGDYLVIRQAKICPFCLKRIGQQAQGIINMHKETEPDIEDNYNISIFVEHMD